VTQKDHFILRQLCHFCRSGYEALNRPESQAVDSRLHRG